MDELMTKKDVKEILKCGDVKANQILKMKQMNGFKIGKFWYAKKQDFENFLESAKYSGVDILY